MSQVLRRLRLGADGVPNRNNSLYALLSQKPSNHSVGDCLLTFSQRKLLHQQALLQNTEKCIFKGATTATLSSFFQHRRSMSILTDLLRRKKKTDTEEAEEENAPESRVLPLYHEEPKALTEEEIEAKRNISRFQPHHQRLVNGQMPYTEPVAWFHHTVKYKQRVFGRYGESSGVNPGILWPTREELKDKIEFETLCNPFTIQEMMEKKRAQRQKEKEEFERRTKDVEAKMAKLDEFKADLLRRQQEKEREANKAKERKEKLVEEVRRHLGFTVDPRDERFQEMLAKKEKEQKKSMKEARKLQKQQRMLDKLQGKSEPKDAEKVKPELKKSEDEDKDAQ